MVWASAGRGGVNKTKIMKTIKILIGLAILAALMAVAHFVGAWLAIVITALIVGYLIFTEFWNQIKPLL